MNKLFNIIVIILIIFNTGVSFYVLKNNSFSSSIKLTSKQNQLINQDKVPLVVQEIRNKNEILKKGKPYLFMGPEELSKYDCLSIADSKEKKQCIDVGENYKVSQLFKGLSQSQIMSFDCTKIQDTTLITRCDNYIKITKEMQAKIKISTK